MDTVIACRYEGGVIIAADSNQARSILNYVDHLGECLPFCFRVELRTMDYLLLRCTPAKERKGGVNGVAASF